MIPAIGLLLVLVCCPLVRAVGPSWEQVLQDPDNIELDFRYAKQQAAKGDMRGALNAAELMLAANPDLPDVRLFYAFVLYRMGDLDEASRQLRILDEQGLPDRLALEERDVQTRIRQEQKRTILSARAGIGFEYDTNRNLSTASGQSLLYDFPLPNLPAHDDTNMIYTGNLELHRDLGTAGGHELFASANFFRTEQTLLHQLDLEVYSMQAGGVYKSPYFHLTPSLLYDYLLLGGNLYYRDQGASLKIDRKLSSKWTVYAQFQQIYQDFVPDSVVPFSEGRSGIQLDVIGGMDYALGPSMRLGGVYDYATKHAADQIHAFRRDSGTLSHTWLLGNGRFLLSSLNLTNDWYPTPDPTVSVRNRHDHLWHWSETYGVPLGQKFIWALTYEYFQAVSTLPNYSYTNNKVSTLLTYQWNAGW